MSRLKTKETRQTVLSHVWMNECRLRITPITLWFRTTLESAARPKWAGIGRGATAVVRRRGPTRVAPTSWVPVSICSLTALRALAGKIQPVGHPGQIRQRSSLHLAHDLATMDFYSDFAHADLVGDLL